MNKICAPHPYFVRHSDTLLFLVETGRGYPRVEARRPKVCYCLPNCTDFHLNPPLRGTIHIIHIISSSDDLNTGVLSRSYRLLGRVVRAAVPIQALMLLLLGVSSLLNLLYLAVHLPQSIAVHILDPLVIRTVHIINPSSSSLLQLGSFNHYNWGLLRTSEGHRKWRLLSGHPYDRASSRGLFSKFTVLKVKMLAWCTFGNF